MNADDSDRSGQDFRSAMAGVRRHAASDRVTRTSPPPSPSPRHSLADEAAVLAELMDGPDPDSFESGDTLTYRAPGVQERVLRQLRRGSFRLEAELDLHGLNRNAARAEVAGFLTDCRNLDRRCVRIIHGKGNGSPNSGPVIKQSLDGWLRKFRDVMAFCSARPQDGGTGAIYVLLRNKP
ncbi:MAG: Smr/MutS family protein [Panacagrimonas sp.]